MDNKTPHQKQSRLKIKHFNFLIYLFNNLNMVVIKLGKLVTILDESKKNVRRAYKF